MCRQKGSSRCSDVTRSKARVIASCYCTLMVAGRHPSQIPTIDLHIMHYWLVVSTPLKNISSSFGIMTFPIYGKSKRTCSKPPTRLLYRTPNAKKKTTIFGGFQSHLMVNHWGWFMAGLPHASMEKNLPTIGALQLCLFINHINYE